MTIIIVEFCMHDKPTEDILSNNSVNKGEGIVASPWVPSTQTLLLCTALCCDHTTSCTQRGTYHHHPGEGQHELQALGWPIAKYGQHVLPPSSSPIYLGGIFCEGQSTYSPQVELVASSQIDENPLRMMPLHYPKVDQWHLGPPNMLPDSAIHRQGAQRMCVWLPYNLHKWIMFVIARHHTNWRLCLWYVIWKAWNLLLLFVDKIFKDYWAESKITATLCSKYWQN